MSTGSLCIIIFLLFITLIHHRSNERKSHKAVHDWIEATRPVISTNVSVIHTRPNQVKPIFEELYGAIHFKNENASCLYFEARFHLSLPSFKRGFFHFFVLDMRPKPIFCSKLSRTAKNCSRLPEPAKNCSKGSEHNQNRPSFNSSVVPC